MLLIKGQYFLSFSPPEIDMYEASYVESKQKNHEGSHSHNDHLSMKPICICVQKKIMKL